MTQDAWFGEKVKIGFAPKSLTPTTGDNNYWVEGMVTDFSQSGGEKETESIPMFAGAFKSYQKPQSDFEVSCEVIFTDTFFDETIFGVDEFYLDTFASYADDAAMYAAWIPDSGSTDASASSPTRDTTYYKNGDAGAKFAWGTYSVGNALYEMDISTVHGATKSVSNITGAASGNPSKGVVEFWTYIADANALAELDTNGIEVRLGSSSANYDSWYVLKSKLAVGWNRCIVSLAGTPDGGTGTPVWTALDYIAINFDLDSGATGDDITIDNLRMYDPTIISSDESKAWRITVLFQTAASASSGEKLRWVFREAKAITWEPESTAEEYLKGTLTFRMSANDSSGSANIKKEHTVDASERSLTNLSNW